MATVSELSPDPGVFLPGTNKGIKSLEGGGYISIVGFSVRIVTMLCWVYALLPGKKASIFWVWAHAQKKIAKDDKTKRCDDQLYQIGTQPQLSRYIVR